MPKTIARDLNNVHSPIYKQFVDSVEDPLNLSTAQYFNAGYNLGAHAQKEMGNAEYKALVAKDDPASESPVMAGMQELIRYMMANSITPKEAILQLKGFARISALSQERGAGNPVPTPREHPAVRQFLHISAGDQMWTPTKEELKDLEERFTKAANAVSGAVVATRDGVQVTAIYPESGNYVQVSVEAKTPPEAGDDHEDETQG